jgi:hypothetical protein
MVYRHKHALSIPCMPLQVCLHSASLVAAKHLGAVMYLDTGNSFSPSRVATIINGTPDVFGQKDSQSTTFLQCSFCCHSESFCCFINS